MLTLDITTRDAQAEVVRTAAINGTIIIKSGEGHALVTIPLGPTPFGPAVNGAISLLAPSWAIAVLDGTATYFELYRSDVSLVLRGSVSATAGDLVLSDTLMYVGDTVVVSTLVYVAPEA